MVVFNKSILENNALWYKKELVGGILPFWEENGLDKVNGGMFTCLDRSGKLMDSTKSVWFQGRCAYAYSYAYNNIDKKNEIDLCEIFIAHHMAKVRYAEEIKNNQE